MTRFITTSANRPWVHVFAALLLTGGVAIADDKPANDATPRKKGNDREVAQAVEAEAAVVEVTVDPAMEASSSSVWDSPTGPYHHPVTQFPVEMGFSQHHSSTLQEGLQRGRAAVIQAQGIYEVNNAQANIINQQARALDLQNDLRLVESQRVRRALRHNFHVANLNRKELSRAQGRLIIAERKATVHRAAYQLSADDFDRNTGAIYWPSALQASKYQSHCERIEELFRSQFAYDEIQPATLVEIERSVDALVKALRSDLGKLPRDDYFAAQKFLRGLKQEAEMFNQVG